MLFSQVVSNSSQHLVKTRVINVEILILWAHELVFGGSEANNHSRLTICREKKSRMFRIACNSLFKQCFLSEKNHLDHPGIDFTQIPCFSSEYNIQYSLFQIPAPMATPRLLSILL
jgi:hypothetical protein